PARIPRVGARAAGSKLSTLQSSTELAAVKRLPDKCERQLRRRSGWPPDAVGANGRPYLELYTARLLGAEAILFCLLRGQTAAVPERPRRPTIPSRWTCAAKAVHIGRGHGGRACRKGYYRRSAMEAAVLHWTAAGDDPRSPRRATFDVPLCRTAVNLHRLDEQWPRVACYQDPSLFVAAGSGCRPALAGALPIKCLDIRTVLANYSGVHPAKGLQPRELNDGSPIWKVNRFSTYSSRFTSPATRFGQFFQDQKYERQLACLAENDSSTPGQLAVQCITYLFTASNSRPVTGHHVFTVLITDLLC
uniref:GMC_OxRdtase_N domain-containing protein n=1 Tax=Macrostomum lignano TaxID=282301 RepID=A0A1I8FKU9_9PLAT